MTGSVDREQGVEATQTNDIERNALLSSTAQEQSVVADVSIDAGAQQVHPEHVTASSTKPLQQPKQSNAIFRHILVGDVLKHSLQQRTVQRG